MSHMIDDLLDPASLPDKTAKVSLVQTHISFVFLTDFFVYKIKKPVNFGFLDFSTLEKRCYYCHQELLLNRRLSQGIYIEVLPVMYDGTAYRMATGEGRVAEYAVKMKRLPDQMLMKSVLLRGELNRDHLRKIAEVLARFHFNAKNSPDIDTFGEPGVFAINTDENFVQTEKYLGITLEKKDFEKLKRWTSNFYRAHGELFGNRISAKKIRDCHGDLHMEHVCLTEDLAIFDCIEFNDRFRYTDGIADIAFLLMDLEYHGAHTFSEMLWDFYRERAGESEREVDSLLTFYKVYRAYVRGKVHSFRLDDEHIETEKREEAIHTAQQYFQLARSYIE